MTHLSRPLAGAALAAALLSSAPSSLARAPAGRYTFPAVGTVFDTKTGRTWQQTPVPGTFTWGAATTAGTAQNACATLSLAGGGWRLPTTRELVTIVDYSTSNPSIDAGAFPNTPAMDFWSSTPANPAIGGSPAWAVRFTDGSPEPVQTTGGFAVRCVR